MANEATPSEVSSGGLSDIAQEVLSGDNEEANDILSTEPAEKKASGPPEGPEDDDDDGDVVGGKTETKTKKSYKLKVNEKEYELDSEEKLIQAAQRGLATQQQWQKMKSELEELRANLQGKLREAEERDQLISSDPAAYIKKTNKNAEDIMEKILLERAREWQAMEGMSERERQLYLANKQYQNQLAEREEAIKAVESKRHEALVVEQKKQLGDLFSKALTDAQMKVTPRTIREMANVYRAALSRGIELSAEDAAKYTKQSLSELSGDGSDVSKMKAEDFVSKYPELTESIRKLLVSRAKSKSSEPQDEPRKNSKGATRGNQARLDDGKSWDKMIDKLKKEGNALNVKARW